MNCERFDRWLDDGRPAADDAAARHARGCDRCAAALGAALELEASLASTAAAPAGFTDRVMARVARTPQAAPAALRPRHAVAPLVAPAMPWWVRAATQPPALMAVVLAALLAGWSGALFDAARAGASLLAGALARDAFAGGGFVLFDDPRLATAVAVALAPSLVWTSVQLYAWGRRLGR